MVRRACSEPDLYELLNNVFMKKTLGTALFGQFFADFLRVPLKHVSDASGWLDFPKNIGKHEVLT